MTNYLEICTGESKSEQKLKSTDKNTKEIPCAIWYYFYNFKNVKNTHGGQILLLKFQALTKSVTPTWVISRI